MRLDPVLLVAQDAPSATMPTRRAFLFGGAMFATGLSLGGACGYAFGARRAEAPAPAPASDDFEKSGDADLDELRRLAVKAPIEELVKHDAMFVTLVSRTYRRDLYLWRGMRRLADHVLENRAYPNRRMMAGVLIQAFRAGEPSFAIYPPDRLRQLGEVR